MAKRFADGTQKLWATGAVHAGLRAHAKYCKPKYFKENDGLPADMLGLETLEVGEMHVLEVRWGWGGVECVGGVGGGGWGGGGGGAQQAWCPGSMHSASLQNQQRCLGCALHAPCMLPD